MQNNEHHTKSAYLKSARLYRQMLQWQLLATLLVALMSQLLAGQAAAISGLIGGAAVIIGAWLAARVALKGYLKQQASAVLINLLKAEAVKILVIAFVLLVAFKLYQSLVPAALIAGLAVSALCSGFALAKSDAPV